MRTKERAKPKSEEYGKLHTEKCRLRRKKGKTPASLINIQYQPREEAKRMAGLRRMASGRSGIHNVVLIKAGPCKQVVRQISKGHIKLVGRTGTRTLPPLKRNHGEKLRKGRKERKAEKKREGKREEN